MSEIKSYQTKSGISIMTYWISNFVIDLILFYVPATISMGFAYWYYNFIVTQMWIYIFLVPPPLIAFSYLTVYFFDKEASALWFHLYLHPIFSANVPMIMVVARVLYPD